VLSPLDRCEESREAYSQDGVAETSLRESGGKGDGESDPLYDGDDVGLPVVAITPAHTVRTWLRHLGAGSLARAVLASFTVLLGRLQ